MSFPCGLQEWPEDYYPPYANGPAYIVSSDIAQFIISEFEKNKLEVCCITLLFFNLPLPPPLFVCAYAVFLFVHHAHIHVTCFSSCGGC